MTAIPLLRWRKPLMKAQDGGARSAWLLYPELVFHGPAPTGTKAFVLIDDVCTGGGHIQACAAKLRDQGLVSTLAVCGGRTFHEQQPDPFSLLPAIYDDYKPLAF